MRLSILHSVPSKWENCVHNDFIHFIQHNNNNLLFNIDYGIGTFHLVLMIFVFLRKGTTNIFYLFIYGISVSLKA